MRSLSKFRNTFFCLIYICWASFYKIINTYNLPESIVNNISLMRIANFSALAAISIVILINLEMENFRLNVIRICGELFLIILASVISSNSTGMAFIVSIILIISSRNINFETILKGFLFFSIVVFLLGLLLNYCGILPSMIRIEGLRLRNSLGFSYVSFPSQVLFYILAAWVVWRKEKISYIELAILGIFTIEIYEKTRTTSPFVLSVLLIGYVLLLKIFNLSSIITRFKLTRILSSLTFPIAFFSLLWLMFKAPSSIFQKVDQMVNNRLSLSLNGIKEFGSSLLGKKAVFSGYDAFGGSLNYNFVDSSYIQSLILNGWLFTIIIIFLFTVVCVKAVREKQEYLIVVLIIISIHSMFDPQLMLLWYSPFPFLLGKTFNKDFWNEIFRLEKE